MNILYWTNLLPVATAGGIERATCSVAAALEATGRVRCYSAYHHPSQGDVPPCFCGSAKAGTTAELVRLCRRWDIDVVVVQSSRHGSLRLPALLRQAGLGTSTKVVFAHHGEPGFERFLYDYAPRDLLRQVRICQGMSQKARALAKLLAHPALVLYDRSSDPPRSALRLSDEYASAYRLSDAVVLLSRAFVGPFSGIACVRDQARYRIIPNPLSFDSFADEACIKSKGKTVLVVSRFDEAQKRLLLALRIWELIERDPRSLGWELRLVGYGDYEGEYRRFVHDHALRRVSILGQRDPEGDYRESSLFFMTSRSEGWGITLTEAQQYGVVPIAFDTYASLRDIINDRVSGVIVEEGDLAGYAEAALSLMGDDARRQGMASACVRSARRFAPERVVGQWLGLFDELLGAEGAPVAGFGGGRP